MSLVTETIIYILLIMNMFKQDLTRDGLHPNDAGYAVMAPLAEKAIAKALQERPASRNTSSKHGTKQAKSERGN